MLIKKLVSSIFFNPPNMSKKILKDELTYALPSFPENITNEEKVSFLLDQLTLDEKIHLLAGEQTFAVSGVERLNIPRVWTSDASSGIRTYGRSTAFPVMVALTASWNKELLERVGETIGEECRAKGISVLLAPGVNIYRVPTNGRNFEYMGEDPCLASELVVPYIKGVQSKGVVTTVKHFAVNNSEYDRHFTDTIVDERTLHEIYFPAFRAAIEKAKSKGVMCAYNLYNGVHCSEHEWLLTTILRSTWGFDGFVISDWDSMYSSSGPLLAGLDIEMPKPKHYAKKTLLELLETKEITIEDIDTRVRNILSVFISMGIYERPLKDSSAIEFGKEHDIIALDAARESVVLLKNENNFLPLNSEKKLKIVVVGRNGHLTPTSGGGSCFVKPHSSLSIYEAMKSLSQKADDITFINAKLHKLSKKQSNIVSTADVVVVCVGFNLYEESECWDRPWILHKGQDKLIKTVSSLNNNTIVVLNAGGDIETESWVHNVPAFIHSFYLGQSAGIPIAEIIFGITNPSGKLPFTMAKHYHDYSTTAHYVPDPTKTSINQIRQRTSEKFRYYSTLCLRYSEGIMVGYRHFDTNDVKPQFPFGHGLSYTNFEYSDLKLDKKKYSTEETVQCSLKVKNIGEYEGKEVIQCYVRAIDSKVVRPFKELKSFAKISLKPTKEETVIISIPIEDLAYYEQEEAQWINEKSSYELLIGSSSRDIRLQTTFEVK